MTNLLKNTASIKIIVYGSEYRRCSHTIIGRPVLVHRLRPPLPTSRGLNSWVKLLSTFALPTPIRLPQIKSNQIKSSICSMGHEGPYAMSFIILAHSQRLSMAPLRLTRLHPMAPHTQPRLWPTPAAGSVSFETPRMRCSHWPCSNIAMSLLAYRIMHMLHVTLLGANTLRGNFFEGCVLHHLHCLAVDIHGR
jgi:hypothetical protein